MLNSLDHDADSTHLADAAILKRSSENESRLAIEFRSGAFWQLENRAYVWVLQGRNLPFIQATT